MKFLFPILLLLIGCNSQVAGLGSIQGIRDPNNPLASIINITPSLDGVYGPTQVLSFDVQFSEPVNVNGTPQLGLTTDNGVLLYANYISGSNTNVLTFSYTVTSGDMDSDGVALMGPLYLNGGTIITPEDNDPALLDFAPVSTGIQINAANTSAMSITPPAPGTYKQGDDLDFIINYSHPTQTSGSPFLSLDIGGSPVSAFYVSGDGSTTHIYRVSLSSDYIDNDGVSFASGIDLNGGTITDVFGDNAASITLSPINFPGVWVDSTPPSIVNVTAPADATYYTNQDLDFVMTFSEPVNVSGSPRLIVRVGPNSSPTNRLATYQSGSGTNTLTFRYTVLSGHNDFDGISIASYLDLNGGSVTDTPGNNLWSNTLTSPTTTGIKVDTNPPNLASVVINPTGTTLVTGSNIDVTVNSGSILYVTGSPSIKLDIGGEIRDAVYLSGSGISNSLVFRYVVETGLTDNDGIYARSPIALNGGTIKDGSSPLANDLPLTFSDVHSATTLVDSKAPTIISVTPPANGSYRPGDQLSFEATFDEPVTATAGASIDFTINASGSKKAVSAAALNSSTITFSYTILSGDEDYNGLTLDFSSIQLNGASINDVNGNAAELDFTPFSLAKVFCIPATLDHWFDISDTSTRGTTPSDYLLEFKSKSSTLSSTISGTPDFNDPADPNYINFQSGDSILLNPISSVSHILIVYRVPNTADSTSLFYDVSGTIDGLKAQVTFDSTGPAITSGTNCQYSCQLFNGSSWTTAGYQGFFSPYDWITSPKRMILIHYPTALASPEIKLSHNDFTGDIAEVMVFSGTTTDPTFTNIGNYLSNKYSIYGVQW